MANVQNVGVIDDYVALLFARGIIKIRASGNKYRLRTDLKEESAFVSQQRLSGVVPSAGGPALERGQVQAQDCLHCCCVALAPMNIGATSEWGLTLRGRIEVSTAAWNNKYSYFYFCYSLSIFKCFVPKCRYIFDIWIYIYLFGSCQKYIFLISHYR